MEYVPISFKSDYSLLKSLLKIKDIIDFAKSKNSTYIGILDDNPYAIMDFYDKCNKNNLSMIFGMIITFNSVKLYLYIENYDGYLNLIKLNDLKNKEELTFEHILKYNKGLILILPFESYNLINRFKGVFKVYLSYKTKEELTIAQKITYNVLFLNEILYINKQDINLLKILYKINNDNYQDNDNYFLEGDDFDKETILNFIKDIHIEFNFQEKYIPLYCETKEQSITLLRTLAINGLKKRLKGRVTKEYADRLKHELNVIESMGFVDYFLIVYDYVKYARQNDIMAVPRGSAAGSLVSYAIGISEVDPIEYDLLFERFLNPERVTMPDIDMDFEDTRRESIIEYVRKKYGKDKVALIVAYGTLGSKQVIRDVGKVLNIDDNLIDKLSKLIDAKKTLKDNLTNNELVNYVKENNLITMYKISMRLEGLKRHTTIHAAGVVISSIPLLDIVPTYKSGDGMLTGYTMEYLERLGLLKMDFLALRNLTTIHNMLKLVINENKTFKLNNIPFNDIKTYQIFQRGDTDNVFQFESTGMKNFLRKLCPTKFDDLVAANALFRPGPMTNIDEYIERRHGRKEITYLHPDLKPILESTYGIIIYQEQIMQILVLMGGYTFAEADLIRRAMSKKKHDVMEEEEKKFIKRAVEKGYNSNTSKEVYSLIVKFANYGFNKSHSVAYAKVGYQMAYLKANYPNVFEVNTLNMNISSNTKIKDVLASAKMRGLNIIKPDINTSGYEYVIKDSNLYLPLTSIKDIGTNVSKVIIDNAPYSDFFDFFKKVYNNNVNRNIIERLIKAGAFDSLNYKRKTLLLNIDTVLNYIELCNTLDESLIEKPELIEAQEEDEELNEIDTFGFYITGHPVSKISTNSKFKIKDIGNYNDKFVTFGALVEKVKVITTKNKEDMAFLDISDETGTIDAVIFPKNNNLLQRFNENDLVIINARIGLRDGNYQVIINDLSIYEEKKE